MATPSQSLFILAPDTTTASHIRHRCSLRGFDATISLPDDRSRIQKAMQAMDDATTPVLLLVPDQRMTMEPVRLAQHCLERRGLFLVWKGETDDSDAWIAHQLLSGSGALIDTCLDVLLDAAMVFICTRPAGFFRVRISDSRSDLGRRLQGSLGGIGRGKGPSLNLVIDGDGAVRIADRSTTASLLSGPPELAQVCQLLRGRTQSIPTPDPTVVPDDEIVSMIVRPPARMLSETASKRLLAAFGMTLPDESLCQSPSAAARFARHSDGPFVLKLVRPGLRNKKEIGAVREGLHSAADIRSAYQSLVELGQRLRPPDPLGILISQQVNGHVVALRRIRHGIFGDLLLLENPGRTPTTGIGAFPADAPAWQIRRSLDALGPGEEAADALTDSLFRFAAALRICGSRIADAEGLLAVPESGPALLVDAFIAIADDPENQK